MIINQQEILDAIEAGKQATRLDEILAAARRGDGLSPVEVSALFQNADAEVLAEVYEIASDLRRRTKGTAASLYTCLYITNECLNDCSYCAFRRSNPGIQRITLTAEQIAEEAEAIGAGGVTNLILIGGTLEESDYRDLIVEGTRRIKELSLNPWIEFENLSLDTLAAIKDAGADHFILFQETYDKQKYEGIHRASTSAFKYDFDARLQRVEDAVDAGFSNIGIGALFGLNKSDVFEVLGLYQHARHLQRRGVDVCISLPTLKPASGLSIGLDRVTEDQIVKIYAVLRCALPEVSLAISGRENESARDRAFSVADQVGSGGTPNPGARTVYKEQFARGEAQFLIVDQRAPSEVRRHLQMRGVTVRHQLGWGAAPS